MADTCYLVWLLINLETKADRNVLFASISPFFRVRESHKKQFEVRQSSAIWDSKMADKRVLVWPLTNLETKADINVLFAACSPFSGSGSLVEPV